MTDLEVQQHPKHIPHSITYLYSTPRTSYLQYMVVAQKVESENEEIQDKVRARVQWPLPLGRKPQN